MNLFTIGSGRKQGVTEEELLAAFADDGARGEGLILENEDGSSLVAAGEAFGPYTLEHFPGERNGTHLRAGEELKKGEVRDAMVDYLRGGSAWRDSCAWREVEDEKGGLAALMAALSTAAPWVLIVVGGVASSFAASRILFLGAPAGVFAFGALAGLACLTLGVALAVRNRFREAPRA